MKKMFSLLNTMIVASCVFSQTFTIKETETINLDFNSDEIIAFKNDVIKTTIDPNNRIGSHNKKTRYEIVLERYDNTLKLVVENRLFDGEKKLGYQCFKLFNANGRLFLIFQEISKGNDLGAFFATEIDPVTLKGMSTKKILDIADKENYENVLDNNEWAFKPPPAYFTLTLQPDKKHTLLEIPIENNKSNQKYLFALFDESFNLIFNRSVSTNVPPDDHIPLGSLLVDDNIFMSYLDYPKGKEFILVSQAKTNKIIKLEVPSNGFTFIKHQLMFDPVNKKLIIVGKYDAEESILKGIFIEELNTKDFTIGKPQMIPIPVSIHDKIIAESFWGKPGHPVYFGYKPFFCEDGSINIIIEPMQTNRSTIKTSYRHGSLINVHVKGEEVTFTRVPKDAEDYYGFFTSYFSLTRKGKVIILYNDMAGNVDIHQNEIPEANKWNHKTVTMAAIIDERGQLTRKIVDNFGADKFALLPEWPIILDDGSIMIFKRSIQLVAVSRDKMKVARIHIE